MLQEEAWVERRGEDAAATAATPLRHYGAVRALVWIGWAGHDAPPGRLCARVYLSEMALPPLRQEFGHGRVLHTPEGHQDVILLRAVAGDGGYLGKTALAKYSLHGPERQASATTPSGTLAKGPVVADVTRLSGHS